MHQQIGNRLTVCPLSALEEDLPVCSEGVWHNPQPIRLNFALPALMEFALTFPYELTGVGGAENRMET